jgi:NhaP-type Na+/H+ or K+/H+ antiporter
VESTLYSLVFGESVLNDAVAIVMYHTILMYEAESVTVGSVFKGVFTFLENFVGSLAIGVIIGLVSALMFKHIRIQVLLC